MPHGRKTGGRTAGTPNKRSALAAQRLRRLGVDPLTILATLAKDEAVDVGVRCRAASELAGYVYPKLKAIAVEVETVAVPSPLVIGPPLPLPDDGGPQLTRDADRSA